MSNFNKVFLAVKHQCAKQLKFAEVGSFDAIAKEAGVPLNSLETYFGHLQEIGLIKYSMADRYVYLTTFGNKQDKIAKD